MEVFLIVIASLWLFSFIMRRWLGPWLLRRYVQKMQERMNPSAAQQQTRKKENAVNISRKKKEPHTRTYTSAEDVDYEEVDDEK